MKVVKCILKPSRIVVLKKSLYINNNISNNNNCNCKTKINCPMNGLCNLKNVVYQAIIFPKKNIKNKKKNLYWNFIG